MIPRFEPVAGPTETARFLLDVLFGDRDDRLSVQSFERRFAEYHGVPHAFFVPSARVGLWMLLRGLKYPAGSEIVLPGFTYFAIPAVVLHTGLVPRYADVDPQTYELTPESVEAAVSTRTRAVIPTHLFGRTCPMNGILAVCRHRGLDIVEDCAQACGAHVGTNKAGTVGRAAFFTFGITKNLTTYSGGMLLTADDNLADALDAQLRDFPPVARARLLREGLVAAAMYLATRRLPFNLAVAPLLRCGAPGRPDRVHRAFEEHPHTIEDAGLRRLCRRPTADQARSGMRQMTALDVSNRARRERGMSLDDALRSSGTPGLPLAADPDGDHIYISFAIARERRFDFAQALRRRGVDVAPGYMQACSSMPCLGGKPGRCPQAERVADRILHLPVYPGLRNRDISRIAAAVNEVDRL